MVATGNLMTEIMIMKPEIYAHLYLLKNTYHMQLQNNKKQ